MRQSSLLYTQGKLFLVKKYSAFNGYVTSNFSPIISEDPTPISLAKIQKKDGEGGGCYQQCGLLKLNR